MNVQPNAEAIEAGAQALRDACCPCTDETHAHRTYASLMVGDKVIAVEVAVEDAASTVLAAAGPYLRAQWLAEVDAALDYYRYRDWCRANDRGRPVDGLDNLRAYVADTLGGTTTEGTPR